MNDVTCYLAMLSKERRRKRIGTKVECHWDKSLSIFAAPFGCRMTDQNVEVARLHVLRPR